MFSLDSFSTRSFHPISWAPGDESHLTDEELREDYVGHGRTRRTRRGRLHTDSLRRSPFSDATESDLLALVEAKWAAIDAGQPSVDVPSPPAAVAPRAVPEPVAVQAMRPVVLTNPRPPVLALPDAGLSEREAQRRNNEQALVLMLAELL